MNRRGWVRIVTGVALAVVFAMLGMGTYARAEHQAKFRRAQEQLQRLEGAVKKFYTEHGEWPPNNNLIAVAPNLD